MDAAALRRWLAERGDLLSTFTELEVTHTNEAELLENLGVFWFRIEDWNPGYGFVPLGEDGTGGMFALWIAPHLQGPPVVFFGSEGGAGVLAASPLAFVQALAHGACADEYPTLDAPSRLDVAKNWMLGDASMGDAARAALEGYRGAVEAAFGPIPDFVTLASVDDAMQSEFRRWVTSTQRRAAAKAAVVAREATEQKRSAQREKAACFAGISGPFATSLNDGARLVGRCAGCSATKQVRLVRFEELAFGLCTDCYFSGIW